MDKSPDAFRTISEVAEVLDTPAHVLRFWESRFPQIKPVKRAGGRRYYRPADVALLTGIKRLLHDEGLTIRGVQKLLRDQGVRHVAGLADGSVSAIDLVETEAAQSDPEGAGGHDAIQFDDAAIDAGQPADPVAPSRQADPVPQAPAPTSGLPLFDSPPALNRADPRPAPPKRPTQRDDATFASLVRALPKGSLRGVQPQLADIAQRLAALRARHAARAEGGSD